MPNLIDTHAHLDDSIFANDLENVIRHAAQNGISIVTVGNDYASSVRAVEIAERFPETVSAAIGMHPRFVSVKALGEDKLLDMGKFSELAANPKVVAIGECGLDYHYLPSFVRGPLAKEVEMIKVNQKKVFGRFLQMSREKRLPLLLHCREAEEDMLEMLDLWEKTSGSAGTRGIVHCFTGQWKDARRFFSLNFLISVTGITTYGHFQSELIKKAPLTQLVLESDCPHSTSIKWNIRRSEPAYLGTVAAAVASMRGDSTENVIKTTTENALKLFRRL
jgi:TatD DNase family protein